MLNSGDYNENVFAEFASLNTPVFQEVPDEIDETWQHGVLVGGMASRNWLQVARAYKKAADELLKQALSLYEVDPIVETKNERSIATPSPALVAVTLPLVALVRWPCLRYILAAG